MHFCFRKKRCQVFSITSCRIVHIMLQPCYVQFLKEMGQFLPWIIVMNGLHLQFFEPNKWTCMPSSFLLSYREVQVPWHKGIMSRPGSLVSISLMSVLYHISTALAHCTTALCPLSIPLCLKCISIYYCQQQVVLTWMIDC